MMIYLVLACILSEVIVKTYPFKQPSESEPASQATENQNAEHREHRSVSNHLNGGGGWC